MPKQIDTCKAWNILRLALRWTRKGSVFKRRLLMDQLRLLSKFMKTLRLAAQPHKLSFDETPVFRLKMPRIPCSNPPVDLDDEYELFNVEEQDESCKVDQIRENGEEGINARAAEFIAKFYDQLKLERQMEYHEMHSTIVIE